MTDLILALMEIERSAILYEKPEEALEAIRQRASFALDDAGYSDRP